MPTSVVVEVAEAVRAEIAATDWSRPIEPVRAWRLLADRADLAPIGVTVRPRRAAVLAGSRAHGAWEIEVELSLRHGLGSLETDEIDPLVALVEELAGHFRARRLIGCPEAVWLRTEIDPLAAEEHLDELRQLTAVVVLVYRVGA